MSGEIKIKQKVFRKKDKNSFSNFGYFILPINQSLTYTRCIACCRTLTCKKHVTITRNKIPKIHLQPDFFTSKKMLKTETRKRERKWKTETVIVRKNKGVKALASFRAIQFFCLLGTNKSGVVSTNVTTFFISVEVIQLFNKVYNSSQVTSHFFRK